MDLNNDYKKIYYLYNSQLKYYAYNKFLFILINLFCEILPAFSVSEIFFFKKKIK